ncbi:MAG: 16S rRNA (uracil(1498)-N(3))-methyltransferase [Bacteroidetes bacterium]|nr:16S rRNA (uracil(1498)-N(3))-methyltransferase [Bacteroidota bacterium]
MQLFYYPYLSESEIILPEDESKHCVRVLRKKVGDEIILIDGKGTEAITEIVDDNPKKCRLNIRHRTLHQAHRTFNLHLTVAPTKNFERIEWMIEKCIEMGIDQISFIETGNSERAKINLDRCEKIAISAIKQSKQYWLPRINEIQKIDTFLKNLAPKSENEIRCMAWCETELTEHLNKHFNTLNHKNITILIGPEGDFTANEIHLAKSKDFIPVSLGKNILRTETAAIYATAVINALS